MIIIGLHIGHDCGCAIFRDGRLALVVEAERVLDIKHAAGLQSAVSAAALAMQWLDMAPTDVAGVFVADEIGLDRDPATTVELHGGTLTKRFGVVSEAIAQWMWPDIGLSSDCPVYVVCHSIAHFAAAVYMAGYDSCCALVYDGYGTCCGTMAYDYRAGQLTRLDRWHDKFLIGLRYSAFGWYIREIKNTNFVDLAGKVMGLHAYGAADQALTTAFKAAFRRTDYYEYQNVLIAHLAQYEDFIRLGPWSPRGLQPDCLSAKNAEHLTIIASMQEAMCELVHEEVDQLLAETRQTSLIVSGGCGMNIVVNDRLARLPNIEHLFIPPNCDDRGIAMGAAVIGNSALTGEPLHHPEVPLVAKRNPYQGAPLINDMDPATWSGKIRRLPVNDPASVGHVASLLADGNIIGLVVPGFCELGPRALGRRSILASPTYPGMKDLINTKIKSREWWRPFAPVCCVDDIDEYFDVPRHDPYMILGGKVRLKYRDRLPAITHVDGTARVQCLAERAMNPTLWDLLLDMKKRTGVGVLLNTSFNLGGRPMVNRTKHIFELIDKTKIDGVWLGDLYLSRNEGGGQVKPAAAGVTEFYP